MEQLNGLKTATVTVGTSATEIKAGLNHRRQLIIYPPSEGTIYWGDSEVTLAIGAPLAAGDAPVIISNITPSSGLKIYGITSGSSRAVRVVEAN